MKTATAATDETINDALASEINRAREIFAELTQRLATVPTSFRVLLEIAQVSQAVVDETIRQTLRAAGESSQTVSCHGCRTGSCCYMNVDTGIGDALLIVDRLAAAGRIQDLLPRIERQHREQASSASLSDWYSKRIPCVFLDGGSCSIYPVRPTACRSHFVASPAERCATDESIAAMDPVFVSVRRTPFEGVLRLMLDLSPDGWSTLPGAVWAVGRSLWCKENFNAFRKRLRRDWAQVQFAPPDRIRSPHLDAAVRRVSGG